MCGKELISSQNHQPQGHAFLKMWHDLCVSFVMATQTFCVYICMCIYVLRSDIQVASQLLPLTRSFLIYEPKHSSNIQISVPLPGAQSSQHSNFSLRYKPYLIFNHSTQKTFIHSLLASKASEEIFKAL